MHCFDLAVVFLHTNRKFGEIHFFFLPSYRLIKLPDLCVTYGDRGKGAFFFLELRASGLRSQM